jgi:hypothetical protein
MEEQQFEYSREVQGLNPAGVKAREEVQNVCTGDINFNY